MFIQTEAGDRPDRMKFLPGRPVCETGNPRFASMEEAARSPLARRLLALDDVVAVELGADHLIVTRAETADWLHVKPKL